MYSQNMGQHSKLMPKRYTPEQTEAALREKWLRLSTDLEYATKFAAEILVRCATCESSLHFAPLHRFELRTGFDYAQADYHCTQEHVTSGVPLSDLARVAITTIYRNQSEPDHPEVVVANTGQYL